MLEAAEPTNDLAQELLAAPLGTRVEIKELWGWVGATLSTNLRGDKVGVYDNRKWRHVKPHLDDMLERRTVRISPLPMAPRRARTPG